LYPQCGFSLASRRISSRSERVSGGRPGNQCEYVHRRAMSWRCQRSSVSGLNGKAAQAARGSERLSAASSARSLVSDAASRAVGGESPAHGGGRGSPTPLSDAAAPAATPAQTGSAQRDTEATRASTPPSTTARAPNLPSRTLQSAADEFANPTGFLNASMSWRDRGREATEVVQECALDDSARPANAQ
jgi:type IV secretory pathway TrbL component